MSILASSWQKLTWGNQHFERLEKALREALDPKAHPVTVESHIDAAQKLSVRVASVPTIPRDCSLIVGDVIHSYRASLDHAAWALVRKARQRLSARQEADVAFSMSWTRAAFDNKRAQRLPGITDEEFALISRYQPYRRTKEGARMRLLQRLSNTDKHRELIVAVMQAWPDSRLRVRAVGYSVPISSVRYMYSRPVQLRVGMLVLEAQLRPLLGVQREVHMEGHISAYPALRQRDTHLTGPPPLSVYDALGSISETINAFLTQLVRIL